LFFTLKAAFLSSGILFAFKEEYTHKYGVFCFAFASSSFVKRPLLKRVFKSIKLGFPKTDETDA